MIEISNVNKYFNKGRKNEIHAINNTSLNLPDSGLVALLGESGCGKTTMLNAIGGLDKVKSGKIIINGKKITRHDMHGVDKIRNLSVGYIFQDYKLIDDISVFDNVALALKMVGIKDKEEQKARVEYVLDKLGILRYRKRPAGTLSGGERQRVGIARALVKNPDIILADEPTGNLDSKNSVEIMNIIKKISSDRLVILVTHERPLAQFYADRIIEVVDGSVVNDYDNDHKDSLDYEIDNVFYLKEFKNHSEFKDEAGDRAVNVYDNGDSKLDINIIVKNGNIYIQSKDAKNVELIDETSSIEVVDDFKQEIDLETVKDYDFDMSKVGSQDIKYHYSSIFRFLGGLVVGFKKFFSFSVLRKLLLLGFVFAGAFIIFAVGRVGATNKIDDTKFLNYNRNYIEVDRPTTNLDEYNELAQLEGVDYVLPGNSGVALQIQFKDYYQTLNVGQTNITGSLASKDLLSSDDIVCGRLPESENEIVIDKRLVEKFLTGNYCQARMCGILTNEDVLDRHCYLNTPLLKDGYTVVGVSDSGSPSFFVDPSQFVMINKYSFEANYGDSMGRYMGYTTDIQDNDGDLTGQLVDYKLYEDKIELTNDWYGKSELPVNDYEVLLSEEYQDKFGIGKETKLRVNGKFLVVSGYYKVDPENPVTGYLVNENTINIKQICDSKNFMICTKDIDGVLEQLNKMEYTAYGVYQKSLETYNEDRAEQVRGVYIAAAVILAISAIEMFLMSRSSFLSRIKEVGTLRAIGAKKTDIYKMFIGEAFAITTLTSLPAMIIMYYLESFLVKRISITGLFYMTIPTLLITILAVYIFNIFIALLPVWNTMRKRPAAILARYDVD